MVASKQCDQSDSSLEIKKNFKEGSLTSFSHVLVLNDDCNITVFCWHGHFVIDKQLSLTIRNK